MHEITAIGDISTGLLPEECCRDTAFLEAACRAHGVTAVERALRRAAEAYGGTIGVIHRALRAEGHWIRRWPEELPALLYNHLRNKGWSAAEITRELRFPGGLPALRLRNATWHSPVELSLVGHYRGIWSCALSSDGKRLVSASRDSTVRVWDLASGEPIAVLWVDEDDARGGSTAALSSYERRARHSDFEVEARDAVMTPDGRRVVSAHSDNLLRVWDVDTGRLIQTLAGHESRVLACAVSPDGKRILSASQDMTLRVWDAETGAVLAVLKGHEQGVRDCAILPDGERCISVSYDGTLRLWSLSSGEQLACLDAGGSRVTLSPDGTRAVVTGDIKDLIKVVDLTTLQVIASFPRREHRGATSCALSPDGKRALVAQGDYTVSVYELATGKEIVSVQVSLFGQQDITLDCAFTPDGKHLISASWDGTIRVLPIDALEKLASAPPPPRHQSSEHLITRRGDRVVSISRCRGFAVWSLSTGERLLAASAAIFDGLPRLQAAGDQVMVVSGGRLLTAFDLETGRERKTMKLDGALARESSHPIIHGERWFLFSAMNEPETQVWDLETGKILGLDEAQRLGCPADVEPSSAQALGASPFGAGRPLRLWRDSPYLSKDAWFLPLSTPDGRHAVIADDNQMSYVIVETASGKVLGSYDCATTGQLGRPLGAVTRDERRLIVSFDGGRHLEVWDLDVGALVASIGTTKPIRSLTATDDVVCVSITDGDLLIFELPHRSA